MKLTFQTLAIVFVFLLIGPGSALADRTAVAPQTGGTVSLFGTTYDVNGIDLRAINWPGLGVLTTAGSGLDFGCGMGVGFVEGANTSLDRIMLTEECGTGGEVGIILTGVDAVDYLPSAAASTGIFMMNNTGNFGIDPSGVEWISDVDLGASKTDINYRVGLGVNFSLAAYDVDDFPMNEWSDASPPGPWEVDSDSGLPYKNYAACKNSKAAGATRMYYGGVDSTHFAYLAFNLTTDSFVNTNSIWLDGIGTPDDAGQPDRALRGMAFDGTYYYIMVKQPGAAEAWLYRYNSLPDAGGSSGAHPDSSPLSAQLDTATGIAYPDGSTRFDRAGIACGRIVNGHPVFYVLADTYLYALTAQAADVDDWSLY